MKECEVCSALTSSHFELKFSFPAIPDRDPDGGAERGEGAGEGAERGGRAAEGGARATEGLPDGRHPTGRIKLQGRAKKFLHI